MYSIVDCSLTIIGLTALYNAYYITFTLLTLYLLPRLYTLVMCTFNSKLSSNSILKNQIILLTGASGGIGFPLTKKLLLQSPTGLILWDNDEITLKKLYNAIITEFPSVNCIFYTEPGVKLMQKDAATETPTTCLFMVVDITRQECFQKSQAIISSYFSSPTTTKTSTTAITCLINNAGLIRPITLPSHLDEPLSSNTNTDTDHTEKLIYNVNCHAPTNLIRELLHSSSKSLQTRQLYISTVASAAAMSYSTQLSAYCGSKAALVQALRAMRLEHQRILYDSSFLVHHNPNPKSSNATTSPTTIFNPSSIIKALVSMTQCVWLQTARFVQDKSTASTKPISHIHWMTYMPWHIDTLMFNNVYSYPFIRFLVPSLTKDYVAQYIINELCDKIITTEVMGHHSSWNEHVLPWVLTLTPLFELLPLWLSDCFVGIAGGWNAMDTWIDPRFGNSPADREPIA